MLLIDLEFLMFWNVLGREVIVFVILFMIVKIYGFCLYFFVKYFLYFFLLKLKLNRLFNFFGIKVLVDKIDWVKWFFKVFLKRFFIFRFICKWYFVDVVN